MTETTHPDPQVDRRDLSVWLKAADSDLQERINHYQTNAEAAP